MPFLTVMTLAAGVALLVLLVASFVPSSRSSRARGMSRSVGLALTEDVRPTVERAIAIRLRATTLGALAGLAGGWLAAASPPLGDIQPWLVVAGLFLGIGLGSAVGAFLARPKPPAPGARVARSRDVRLHDYVMPFELTGARILIAVAIVAAVVVAALLAGIPRETTSLVSLLVVTALALAAQVLFEILGRAIVAQASPAQDPTALAWEDALRAESLRNLVTAPLTFGCVAVVLTVVGAFGVLPLSPVSIILGAVVPIAVLVGALVLAVISLVSKPQQHYLRMLWPETAAAAR